MDRKKSTSMPIASRLKSPCLVGVSTAIATVTAHAMSQTAEHVNIVPALHSQQPIFPPRDEGALAVVLSIPVVSTPCAPRPKSNARDRTSRTSRLKRIIANRCQPNLLRATRISAYAVHQAASAGSFADRWAAEINTLVMPILGGRAILRDTSANG